MILISLEEDLVLIKQSQFEGSVLSLVLWERLHILLKGLDLRIYNSCRVRGGRAEGPIDPGRYHISVLRRVPLSLRDLLKEHFQVDQELSFVLLWLLNGVLEKGGEGTWWVIQHLIVLEYSVEGQALRGFLYQGIKQVASVELWEFYLFKLWESGELAEGGRYLLRCKLLHHLLEIFPSELHLWRSFLCLLYCFLSWNKPAGDLKDLVRLSLA